MTGEAVRIALQERGKAESAEVTDLHASDTSAAETQPCHMSDFKAASESAKGRDDDKHLRRLVHHEHREA